MKVISPVIVTDAMVLADSVAEPTLTAEGDGTATVAWSNATTYPEGAVVYVASTHRTYRSAAAGNLNNDPLTTQYSTPPKWVDIGSTNKWRMLRADANFQTVGASPLAVQIAPGQRVSALAVTGIVADQVDIEMRDGSNVVVYTYSDNLSARQTTTWSGYFFGAFEFADSLLLLDLPLIANGKIKITLTRATGMVRSGPVVLGQPVDLGSTEAGATSGIVDFSTIKRDAFGNASVVVRKAIPRVSVKNLIQKGQVERVRTLLTALRGRTAMYLPVEDDDEPYYGSLAVLGLCKNFNFDFSEEPFGYLTMDIEGL